MKARKVFETMEKGFGPAISILMLVDLGKDLYEYTKEKVQNRKKGRTSNLTPAQGTAFQPIEMNFTGSWEIAKDAFDAAISGTMTARNDAESPAAPIFLSATSSQRDLGDHAEGQETLSMSVEGVGDLYSLTVQRKTELAEAYITSPDAVEIAALDTAGMNALGSEIKQNATGVFLGILMKLPPSVLKLLMKNSGK